MGDSADELDSLTQELLRLRSERAEHQAEALRLRALLAAVPDLIIRIHRDGTYLDFVGAKDIPVLIPREERIGKRVAEVLPPDIAAAYQQATTTALDSQKTQTFGYQLHVGGRLGHYEARVVCSGPDEVIMVNDLLESLGKQYPREAQIVKLHYFAGLTISEAGEAIGVSGRTAYRYWMFARAWLHEALRDDRAKPTNR